MKDKPDRPDRRLRARRRPARLPAPALEPRRFRLGQSDDPDHGGPQRQRPDGAPDRRQSRRRIRGPDRARSISRAPRAGGGVSGRVIIVPFMNFPGLPRRPAPLADRRRQPEPRFPGPARRHRDGEDRRFLPAHLLPMADVVLDFHSGGRTLDFVPFAACHVLPDKAQEARCRRRARCVRRALRDDDAARSTPPECSTRPPRSWARSLSRPSSAAAAPPRRRASAIARRGVTQPAEPCRHPRGQAGAGRSLRRARHAVRRLLHLQRVGRPGRAARRPRPAGSRRRPPGAASVRSTASARAPHRLSRAAWTASLPPATFPA